MIGDVATVGLVAPSDLATRPPFSTLYAIDPDTLAAVQESIERSGFDPAHPIAVWREKQVVVDGHTRLQAARNLDLMTVPICELDFATECEAKTYAVRHQRARRQMNDAEVYRSAIALDCRVPQGDRKSRKFRSKILLLNGTSASDYVSEIVGRNRA